jgi:hypothetical protein
MTTATGRDAIVLDTPDQIGRYRLAVVKQGIKALLRGMKIKQGLHLNCLQELRNGTHRG